VLLKVIVPIKLNVRSSEDDLLTVVVLRKSSWDGYIFDCWVVPLDAF